MKCIAATLISVVLLSGCAATLNTPFHEDAFIWSEQKGTASIIGQAFIKASGSSEIHPARTIKLLPVNNYTTELRNRVTIGGEHIATREPRLERFTRIAEVDGNANFEFHDLPAGSWYLSTLIMWSAPSPYSSIRGSIAYATVTVTEGETKQVLVTNPDGF